MGRRGPREQPHNHQVRPRRSPHEKREDADRSDDSAPRSRSPRLLPPFRFTSSSPYIFAHTGEARSGERIATLRFAFHKAAVAAKIPVAWRVHDLRHRRVTTWLGAGKSPVAVQAAMGHSTITTTMGYFTLLPSTLRSSSMSCPFRQQLTVKARRWPCGVGKDQTRVWFFLFSYSASATAERACTSSRTWRFARLAIARSSLPPARLPSS
jgi:integrase-like protein